MAGEVGVPPLDLVRQAVREEVGGLVDELRRFVDRRIAELSMEVSATVQLVDFSEANLSGQLQRMHDQIASVVALPAAASRTTGLELETVVAETEAAAGRIMTAAETIRILVADGGGDRALLIAQVNEIFEACSFQDLTGQRIRRALQNLQGVEGMLADMVESAGHEKPAPTRRDLIRATAEITGDGPDLAQEEIDRLMAG
jgi:chemotaxis protein CheZ